MSEFTQNKKNLILENVIVSYNPKDDNIYITSQDKDIAGEPFCITLNQESATEKTLRNLLHEKGLINDYQAGDDLPDIVYKPAIVDPLSFDIGLSRKGFVSWSPESHHHLLVTGLTATGKTIFLQNIIQQCIDYDDLYDTHVVSSPIELSLYLKNDSNKSNIINLASDYDSAIRLLTNVSEIINERYMNIKDSNVSHINEVEDEKNKKVIVVVDDFYSLVSGKSGQTDDHIKEFNALFENIVSKGRAVDVYLVLSGHSSDMNYHYLSGRVLSNINSRILLGRETKHVSSMIFNSTKNYNERIHPSQRGRGVAQLYGQSTPILFQSFTKDRK